MAEYEMNPETMRQMQQFRALRRQQGVRTAGQAVGATAGVMQGERAPEALAARPIYDPNSMMSRREKMERQQPIMAQMQQADQFNAGSQNQAVNLAYSEHQAHLRAIIAANTARRGQDLNFEATNRSLATSRLIHEENQMEREFNGLKEMTARGAALVDGVSTNLQSMQQEYASVEYTNLLNEAGIEDPAALSGEESTTYMRMALARAKQNPDYQNAAILAMTDAIGNSVFTLNDNEIANILPAVSQIAGVDESVIIENMPDEVMRQGVSSAIDRDSQHRADIHQAYTERTGDLSSVIRAEAERAGMTLDDKYAGALEGAIKNGEEAKLFGNDSARYTEALMEKAGIDTGTFQKAGGELGAGGDDKAVAPGALGAAEAQLKESAAAETAGGGEVPEGQPQMVMGIPNVVLSSDPTERSLQMMDMIEEYPEHPPLQQLKKDIYASDEFKKYAELRGYTGASPHLIFREMNKEYRGAQRKANKRFRQTRKANIDQGVVEGREWRAKPTSAMDAELRTNPDRNRESISPALRDLKDGGGGGGVNSPEVQRVIDEHGLPGMVKKTNDKGKRRSAGLQGLVQ